MKKIALIFLSILSLLAINSQAAVNIQHWQTATGSAVYFVENHDLPIIDLSVNFAAGSAHDQAEKAGLASLTKYLMKLGAAGLSDEIIAKRFADVGAAMGGSFGADRASMTLRTLSHAKEKTQSLSLFNQILHQPDFSAAVLTREKARIIASIKEAETKPSVIANEAYKKAIYGDHAYALDATVESVTAIERQDLVDFYQHYYGANSAVIAMIGDMTPTEAKAIADNISQGLPKGEKIEKTAKVNKLSSSQEQRIAHPASQADVYYGTVAIKRDDPDLFPLIVGNYILGGGGFVSRLTEDVREKRGLVYSVYSHFSPNLEKGPFTINFQTKKSQADEALQVVKETLNQFLKEGVTDEELKAAKSNIIGGFPMRIDSNKKILGYLAAIGFYKFPLTYLDDYNGKIAAVTKDQIKVAFNRHLNPEQFVTVIVGAE